MVTEAEVRDRVALIARAAGDPEAAHSEEDKLYRDVLRSIASGEAWPDAASVADAALAADDLDFPRWCA